MSNNAVEKSLERITVNDRISLAEQIEKAMISFPTITLKSSFVSFHCDPSLDQRTADIRPLFGAYARLKTRMDLTGIL